MTASRGAGRNAVEFVSEGADVAIFDEAVQPFAERNSHTANALKLKRRVAFIKERRPQGKGRRTRALHIAPSVPGDSQASTNIGKDGAAVAEIVKQVAHDTEHA